MFEKTNSNHTSSEGLNLTSTIKTLVDEYPNDDKTKTQDLIANIIDREAEEKKIVKQLDCRMLPLFCIFYFVDFLDRANIGNAT